MKFGRKRDDVDLVFAETEGGIDRFDETGAVRLGYSEAVLDDLDAGAEAFDFFVRIDADDFVVDPDAEIALLLDEVEERARLCFRRDRDPESDQNILVGELLKNMVRDRLRGLGADFAAAVWAKAARDPRHEELQVIVDLRHRPDGGTRAFHRVRLLDRDGGRNAANFVHARFVHTIEELPHVRAESFDVTSLALRVDRVEGEARFAAAARPGDDA